MLRHIKSAKDLVTPRELTQKGFLFQALRKTEEAAPYIEEARKLQSSLLDAKSVDDAAHMPAIRLELVAAAGFSDKSTNYFTTAELSAAISKVMKQVKLGPQGEWREELVYRFLLTRGDSLGGSMRNIVGAVARGIFTSAVARALTARKLKPQVVRSDRNDHKVQAMSWGERQILFDKSPKFIGKNIDVILLDTALFQGPAHNVLESRETYLACGELKGGIDPAGADEHWKTARAALERIRGAFADSPPHLFFVAAAIEDAMAQEVYEQLATGQLNHAANLLAEDQLADLAGWLVSI